MPLGQQQESSVFGAFYFGQPYFGQDIASLVPDFNFTSDRIYPKNPTGMSVAAKSKTTFSDASKNATGMASAAKSKTSYTDANKPSTGYTDMQKPKTGV